MKLGADDSKNFTQLIALLKRASFKDMSVSECLTVGMTIQWLTDFKKRVDAASAPVPPSTPTPQPPEKVVSIDTKKGRK